jgi:hypothetical protein
LWIAARGLVARLYNVPNRDGRGPASFYQTSRMSPSIGSKANTVSLGC